MTAKEVRDLGYLQWKDPYAWMESMRGKRWEALLHTEKAHYNKLLAQPPVHRLNVQMEKEIKAAHQYLALEPFKIGGGTIDIFLVPSSRFMWKWSWLPRSSEKPAYDVDVQGNIVWYVTSNEDKKYKNQLICEDSTGKRIWSKSAVSSQLAIIDDYCYFVKVVEYFRTVELCVCDAQTGKDERVIYREPDKERDLLLYKTANKTLYLQSQDSISSHLYRVNDLQVIPLYKNSTFQMPLGESVFSDNCVYTRNKVDEPWIPHGKPIENWILPAEEIQWMNLATGHVLTIHEGAQTIWYCAERRRPGILFKIKAGLIDPNIWTKWENSLIQSFHIKCPFDIPHIIHIINNKIIRNPIIYNPKVIKQPLTFPLLDVRRFHVASMDGTMVPYVVIKQKGIIPKAQILYVYGAYGDTTPIDWPYQNWYPLLIRKWAIVFAFVRGGGDVDAAWAEAARREHRHVSVDDFESVIRAAQHRLHLGPDKTVLYGRSAGGLPVGAMVSRYPDGQLVGAAYTEVPYVDVLRTSSNPDLPLTIGEYKEFGNPREILSQFKELLEVSPVNTVPSDGAPGVFVMSHVGLLDKQVYAYESFKWIQRLRGLHSMQNDKESSDPKGKYVTFERHEAHTYDIKHLPRFRSMDLAILEAWVEKKLR